MTERIRRTWFCTTATIALFALGFAGCSGATTGTGGDSENEGSISKEEARERQQSKADHGVDYCARYDYYDDGICDDWCPDPDPDCGSAGCQDDSDCASGEFCSKSGADACTNSATGSCETQPQFCTEEYAPVCGCDGNTYGNDCKAKAAGVNVASQGECGNNGGSYDPCANKACGDTCTVCPPNDPTCVETSVVKYCQPDGSCEATTPQCSGTSGCTSDSDCGSGEFCSKTGSSACSSSTTGTCETQPQFCTEEYAPVCGCDGNTYGNDCKAKAAGVNVAGQGECGNNGGSYDPCANKACGDTCTVCPPNDPTCVESSVVKYCQPDGSCEATTPQCSGTSGCTSDSDCGSGEFCSKTGSSACSSSTTGTCETQPQFCTEEYAPVCGCDGITYGNDCKARSAGVNIAHTGSCT